MADIVRFIRFDDQPPLVRLIFSICVVIVTGTIFFWLLMLTGSLIFHVSPSVMRQIPSADTNSPGSLILKYVQFSQQVGLFLMPAILTIYLVKEPDSPFPGLNKHPGILPVALVVFLAFILIPLLNFTAELNSRMILPESFAGLQKWMETNENAASHLTTLLITSSGLVTLGINIIILALVPAFCEEILFRGLFQKLISQTFRSGHAGVWITAIVFTTIHFQFFGFIPRLILGLVFGYLFFWTGNLWYSIVAHFVNNLVAVMISYYSGLNEAGERIKDLNVTAGFPVVALLLSSLILFYFWRESKSRLLAGDTVSPADKMTTGDTV